MATENKKRKQHYVWQHYLKAWESGGNLWCQRGKRRFETGTGNVAARKDFYRLEEIGPREIQFVREFIVKRSAPHLRELLDGWIPLFTELHQIKARYDASGGKDPEIERELDVAINNLEEDLHARVEVGAIPVLTALREGNANFLANQAARCDFCWFIGTQYMRTPQLQRKAIEALGDLSTRHNINVAAAWPLMRTLYSTNMGSAMVSRLELLRMTFLEAPTDAEFIASDQPLINLRALGLPEGTPPTDLEFYYPLSPKRAIVLDFQYGEQKVERRFVARAEVVDLNRKLAAHSEEQFFAATEAGLDSMIRA